MNYAYMTCSKDFWPYAEICIRSLGQHSDCTLLFNAYGWLNGNVKELEADMKCTYPGRSLIYMIPEKEWKGRIAKCKVERLECMPFQDGDNVLLIDADLIFKVDPFKIFDIWPEVDVFLTERHYDYHFPINGGLYGFRLFEAGWKFMRMHIDEVKNPMWPPYVQWLKKYWHWGQENWGVGQDFLCAIHMAGLPFEGILKILGPEWNWCPSIEEDRLEETLKPAREDMARAEKNPDIKVLHYKGRLKEMML